MIPRRRKDGRKLGAGILTSSVAGGLYLSYLSKKSNIPAGICVTLFGCGTCLWLWTRRYLDDPEALAEYRAEVMRYTVKEALRNYTDTDSILKIISMEEWRVKVVSEVPGETLKAMFDHHGEAQMENFLKDGVLSKELLQRRLEVDLRRHSGQNFTTLWRHFDNRLDHFLSMTGSLGMHMDLLRSMLLEEFYWVREDGSLKPCAPPANRIPGAPETIWNAVLSYHTWTMKNLSLAPEFYRTVLTTCQEGQTAPLSSHCLSSLQYFDCGLLTMDWIREKFLTEAADNKYDLNALEKKLLLRKWLSRKVIQPLDVAAQFDEGIRTAKHALQFAKDWEDVLKKDGTKLLKPQTMYALQYAVTMWNHAERTSKDDEEEADRQRRSTVAGVSATYDVQESALRNPTLAPGQHEETIPQRDKRLKRLHEVQQERSREINRIEAHSKEILKRIDDKKQRQWLDAHGAFLSMLAGSIPSASTLQQGIAPPPSGRNSGCEHQ